MNLRGTIATLHHRRHSTRVFRHSRSRAHFYVEAGSLSPTLVRRGPHTKVNRKNVQVGAHPGRCGRLARRGVGRRGERSLYTHGHVHAAAPADRLGRCPRLPAEADRRRAQLPRPRSHREQLHRAGKKLKLATAEYFLSF